jgi:hypothetical protein
MAFASTFLVMAPSGPLIKFLFIKENYLFQNGDFSSTKRGLTVMAVSLRRGLSVLCTSVCRRGTHCSVTLNGIHNRRRVTVNRFIAGGGGRGRRRDNTWAHHIRILPNGFHDSCLTTRRSRDMFVRTNSWKYFTTKLFLNTSIRTV